jgi:hypothetical protein
MPIAILRSPPFDLIRCDDPRLRVACPAVAALGADTLAEMALNADPATEHVLVDAAEYLSVWAQRTAVAPLDDLAIELLQAWERLRPTDSIHRDFPPDRRRQRGLAPPLRPAVRLAVARRMGLLGDPPATLTACIPGTSIKIERLRQITLQLRVVAAEWVWAPALDHALDLGRELVDRQEYAEMLHQRGLARRPWYPEAVEALARLCGRDQRVTTYPDLDQRQVLVTAEQVIDRHHFDVAPIRDVAAVVAEQEHRPVTTRMVTAALSVDTHGLITNGTWVWRSGTHRRLPRVLRVARGMLAVAGSLSIPTIHQGWCRRLRGSGIRAQPPIEALDAMLRTDVRFVVDDQPNDAPAVVRLAQPLRPEQVHSPLVNALIRTIRTAPGQVATRSELDEAAADAGATIHGVSKYLAYHEVFVRCGQGLWTLVGVHVDLNAADAARKASPAL